MVSAPESETMCADRAPATLVRRPAQRRPQVVVPPRSDPIPFPLHVLWREFRIRVLPFLLFLAAVAGVVWLWL